MKIFKVVGILLGVVLIAGACNPKQSAEGLETKTLQIGNEIISVEIADTPEKKAIGLSGRKSLEPNTGMLFVFEEEGLHTFWMKDTLIPLDFIWIKSGKVVEITSNVGVELGKKDSELSRYTPTIPVDSMLEMNSGWAEKHGVKAGDNVLFLTPGNRP